MRRARFIYDFFLTAERPRGGEAVADSITHEVTINLANSPRFPGSQPPGCLDPSSRLGARASATKCSGPVLEKANRVEM